MSLLLMKQVPNIIMAHIIISVNIQSSPKIRQWGNSPKMRGTSNFQAYKCYQDLIKCLGFCFKICFLCSFIVQFVNFYHLIFYWCNIFIFTRWGPIYVFIFIMQEGALWKNNRSAFFAACFNFAELIRRNWLGMAKNGQMDWCARTTRA